MQFVVMTSGSGSTFEALANAVRAGAVPIPMNSLIVSNRKAPALERAHRLKIPALVVDPRDFPNPISWDETLARSLEALAPDWIVLAGFTQKLGSQVLRAFTGRIVNTHPSLLPKYGGKGMYGHYVHEAVIAASETETGISIHLVTEDYDAGPILAQKKMKVLPHDTPESLAERLKAAEKDFYIDTLAQLFRGDLLVPTP